MFACRFRGNEQTEDEFTHLYSLKLIAFISLFYPVSYCLVLDYVRPLKLVCFSFGVDDQTGKLAVTRIGHFLLCLYADKAIEMGLLKSKVLCLLFPARVSF